MKKKIYLAGLFAILSIAGCENNEQTLVTHLDTESLSMSECKTKESKNESSTNLREALIYKLQDDRTLSFTHENYYCGCSTTDFKVDISCTTDTLAIYEEAIDDMLSNCLCPFDTRFAVKNLTVNNFVLKYVKAHYKDRPYYFKIDLDKEPEKALPL